MSVIQRQTEVHASDAEVFTYLIDVTNHPQWASHQLEVKKASEGPVQAGSKFETVGHQFGEQPGTVTITEAVPNSRIVYESDGKVGHFRHSLLIEPEADGDVKVTKTMEMIEVKSLPLKIMRPIVSSFIAPRGLDGDLKRIKEKLETQ
jgi:uncharacterized protein YndB with AHSA1/START domain